MKPFFFPFILSLAFLLPAAPLSAQSNPYRGLWVGEVTLGAVNEVTIPLDAGNVPRAPDPNAPTPTFDSANLRLILHVDAAGRTSLLKHVAVLARKAGVQEKESDLALVTDERLYGAFPPQPAQRISSVVFDFGDARATAAVNEIAERAAAAAATEAAKSGATAQSVTNAARQAAAPVATEADAEAAFTNFLQNHLNAAKVRAIAAGGSSADARAAATDTLRDGSFYRDTRGIEMLDAIEAALAALPGTATAGERERTALNTAAAFAETDLAYDRFLAGEMFGDMIAAAAEAAAQAAHGLETKAISAYQTAEGGASTAAVSTAHGLVTGDEVAILGAAVDAYNGLHQVVRVDANRFRIAVPYVTGGAISGYSAFTGSAPLRVISPGHGLSSGDWITLRDSLADYNGRHLVTVFDEDTFTLDLPFVSDPDERGVWSIRSGDIAGYEGTGDGSAGVRIFAPGHGLDNGQTIEIRGAGQASYNGVKTITRIDADSFSIPQAFAGNPAVRGSWDIPVGIGGFEPPETLPTLIAAANHRLATGDRIVISGSGKAAYNGSHEVTVVDAGSFSIPVLFDAATGNPDPAAKGSWQPAPGGEWRKTSAVRAAVDQVAKVAGARTEALRVKITPYGDTRAPDAVEQVIEAIVRSAATAETALASQIASLAGQAGRDELTASVPRYPRPPAGPSAAYTEFVRSQTFTGGVNTAASAAAAGALAEKSNLLATPASIRDKALQAAIEALNPVYAAASRSLLTELPMSGSFGPGTSGLSAEVVLPANHPTNPFRHRRHPDHTTGFDIRRLVNLSFQDRDDRPASRAGYGVDRISGIYEEEIFGLHKPLGPNRDIGLKVRGSFQLHRISRIDTLNGR